MKIDLSKLNYDQIKKLAVHFQIAPCLVRA